MAFDTNAGSIVLFGGVDSAAGQYLNAIWLWDGSAWVRQNPTVSPSPRAPSGMAYDASRGAVIIVGGAASLDNTLNPDTCQELNGA